MEKIRNNFSPLLLVVNFALAILAIVYPLLSKNIAMLGTDPSIFNYILIAIGALWLVYLVKIAISYFKCEQDFLALIRSFLIIQALPLIVWILIWVATKELPLGLIIQVAYLFILVVECISCNNPAEESKLTNLDWCFFGPILLVNVAAVAYVAYNILSLFILK